MSTLRRIVTLFIAFVMLAAGWRSVRAQSVDSKYFSETGHNVVGEFLRFYNSNSNAAFLYGYPITEEFTGKAGKVQYFQRARFEYHAELPQGQQVQVTALGSLMYVTSGKMEVNNTFACQTFTETGYAVCFSFLEFFNDYGGVQQFGYPISGFEYHENKLVQYFEKTRLEWHPWKPEGQRVVVSELGSAYFHQTGEDIALLPPVKPLDGTIQTVLSIRVRAFTWKAVTFSNDTQLLFIVVQDQNLQPVGSANCTAIVHWSNGHNDAYPLATNASGVAIIPLTYTDQISGGLIYADVSCAYNGLNGTSTTSFRIWY